MAIVKKCTEATFILTVEDGLESVNRYDSFNYLGQLLYQLDDNFPAVLKNIRKARKVWGRLGKLLRCEGADIIVSEKFYRAVVQAVLLVGAETWFMTVAMSQKLKGVHVGFLRQVTGKKTRRLGDNYW